MDREKSMALLEELRSIKQAHIDGTTNEIKRNIFDVIDDAERVLDELIKDNDKLYHHLNTENAIQGLARHGLINEAAKKMVSDLRAVERRYEGRIYDTFEVQTGVMARDAADMIVSIAEELARQQILTTALEQAMEEVTRQKNLYRDELGRVNGSLAVVTEGEE